MLLSVQLLSRKIGFAVNTTPHTLPDPEETKRWFLDLLFLL